MKSKFQYYLYDTHDTHGSLMLNGEKVTYDPSNKLSLVKHWMDFILTQGQCITPSIDYISSIKVFLSVLRLPMVSSPI